MSDTLTTSSRLDNLLATYFVRKSLPRLIARAQFYRLCDNKTGLPKGEGSTVRWNAWSNFAAVSCTLAEGTNPTLAGMSSRKVEATIGEYGRGVKISDLVEHVSSLDVFQGAIETLGDAAGLSLDKVVQAGLYTGVSNGHLTKFDTLLSCFMSSVVSGFASTAARVGLSAASRPWGFPVIFSGSATRLSAYHAVSATTAPGVSAKFSLYGIRKTVKALRAKNALEFADGYFKCITNTDAMSDLYQDPAYKAWIQYTNSKPLEQGEVIAPVEGVRVFTSNNMLKNRSANAGTNRYDVDLALIWGQGAFGCVEIGAGAGKGYEIIIKRPGPNDTSNPLNMYGTAAFKFKMVSKALNTSAGRILLCRSDHYA